MLTIRLQRVGKKKKPSYRFVISEKARDPFGKSLEILGLYQPSHKEKTLDLKVDRIKYWLSQGAQTSNTVHNLLVKEGVVSADKKKSVTITNKRKAKLEEKAAEVAEKEKAVKEAAAAAEAEAQAAEEAAKAEADAAKASAEEESKDEAPAEEKKEEDTPTEEPKKDDAPDEDNASEEKES